MASSHPRRPAPWPAVGLGLLAAGSFGVVAIHDLASRPWLSFVCWMTAFVGLGLGSRGRHAARGRSILLMAALLRTVLIPLPPGLSNDVWRYLWDGRVAIAGENPYRFEPEARRLAPVRDDVWSRLDHRDVPTVYPPLALAAFSISAGLPGSLWLWKGLVGLADLLTCWLLIRLCRQRGLPLSRVCWYAWNPLVVLETAGMGHVDALGVAAAVGAVAWLGGSGSRGWISPLAAAAGALVKLAPLAAWPLWARASGRPARYLLLAGGVTALALVPVVVSVGGVPPGLVTYAVSWEFNGPLYEPLWRSLDALAVDRGLHGTLDRIKAWTGEHERWNRFYPWVYPRFLAKLLLAGLAAGVWLRSWWIRDPVRGSGFLFGGLLLSLATVYPWYLLWVLPWAALLRWRSWLVASALAPLSYLASVDGAPLWPWVWLAIWGPFFLLLVLDSRRPEADVE